MDCQVCGSEWCWICGVDIDSPIHYCMYVPCSLINFILPLVSIPIFFRIIMIIFTLIFGLPVCLLMYGFFMPFKFAEWVRLTCCDYVNCYQSTTSGCDWCFQGLCFLLVVLPPLLVLTTIAIPCSLITFGVLIAPGYIIAFVSFVYMCIYSVQKKHIQAGYENKRTEAKKRFSSQYKEKNTP